MLDVSKHGTTVRDADDLVMFACLVQLAVREGHEHEAAQALKRLEHRAYLIARVLPSEPMAQTAPSE